jgi:hypothetical protein
MYLKVSPMKGVKRFRVSGKLSPRYIRPFPILEKCGNVTYKLELPPSLAGVHDIFHISQLKKCLKTPVNVVLLEVAPLDTDLTYPERPIKILDQKSRVTRRKMIKFYKIQGATIRKKKQHGRVKISSILVIRTLSCRRQGTCDCSLSLFEPFSFSNHGTLL